MANGIQILIWVALFGFVTFLIQRVVPMTEQIKTIFNAAAAIFVLLFVLNALGVFNGLGNP